jgi:kynureninase
MSLDYLGLAHSQLKDPTDKDFAVYLDSLYSTFRNDFHIPTNEGVGATEHSNPHKECIYLCGNSLGLQPRLTKKLVQAELDIWASRGVQGHFRHDKWPWVSIHETCTSGIAAIVGANVDEVAIMGSLTANLHLLMAAFYVPTPQRHKIIIESKAFPSDHVYHILDESHSSTLLNLRFDGMDSTQLRHLFK